MYDMLLAMLFFFVVLSPLMIHVGLNLAERIALRREALNLADSQRKRKTHAARGPRTLSGAGGQFRRAICSVTIWVRSGFFRPWTSSLNSSTLLDQFMEQNFGPHMEQNAASL